MQNNHSIFNRRPLTPSYEQQQDNAGNSFGQLNCSTTTTTTAAAGNAVVNAKKNLQQLQQLQMQIQLQRPLPMPIPAVHSQSHSQSQSLQASSSHPLLLPMPINFNNNNNSNGMYVQQQHQLGQQHPPRLTSIDTSFIVHNNSSSSNLSSSSSSFSAGAHHNNHNNNNTTTSYGSYGSSVGSQVLMEQRENQHAVEYRRSTDVALCKTILTTYTMAPYFPKFVATFIYSIWHNQSFTHLTLYPSQGLTEFSSFVRELLKITKLSFSVVILSLKYIHRIKHRCRELQGKPGSEYRLLVCTLNLAMKYLVDHTYSNKTWHKLSRIPLLEINMAEQEFMTQLDYDLHVEQENFFAWLMVVDDSFSKFRRLLDISKRHLTPPLTPTSPSVLPPTPTTTVALPAHPLVGSSGSW